MLIQSAAGAFPGDGTRLLGRLMNRATVSALETLMGESREDVVAARRGLAAGEHVCTDQEIGRDDLLTHASSPPMIDQ